MKIYLATWLFDKTLGDSCTKLEANRRLLSYHFLAQGRFTTKQIKQYCETGRLDPRKKKRDFKEE